MPRRPTSIRHLLADKPALRRLGGEVGTQQSLLTAVRQRLPGDLATHCVAARRDGRRLVLHVDSPVWASRLHFLSAELRSLLHKDDASLSEIKIRLLPPQQRAERKRPTARHSDVAAAMVSESARTMQPGPLRNALQRLGRTLARKADPGRRA